MAAAVGRRTVVALGRLPAATHRGREAAAGGWIGRTASRIGGTAMGGNGGSSVSARPNDGWVAVARRGFRLVFVAIGVASVGVLASAVAGSAAQLTSSAAVPANDDSYTWGRGISADGRFVAFQSWASNLVAGDTNRHADVFVRDRKAGTSTRVSVSNGGAQANDGSGNEAISADGRFVAFTSSATNLVRGDTTSCGDRTCRQVFVRDRRARTTTPVSVSSRGRGETTPATVLRSARTGASSRSLRTHRTWSPATPTMTSTCSYTPARREPLSASV